MAFRGTSAAGKKRPPTGGSRPTSGVKKDAKKPQAKQTPSGGEAKKNNEPEAQTGLMAKKSSCSMSFVQN